MPAVVEVAPGVLALAGAGAPAAAGWRAPRRGVGSSSELLEPGRGSQLKAGEAAGATPARVLDDAGADPQPDGLPPGAAGEPGLRGNHRRVGQVVLFAVAGLGCGLAIAAGLGGRPQPAGAPTVVGDTGPPNPAAVLAPPQPGASGDSTALSPAPSAQRGAAPDWVEVLGELDRIRSKALMGADRKTLAKAVAADSPAWNADIALLDQLKDRGVRPRSLRTELVAAVPTTAAGAPSGSAAGPSLDRAGGVALLVTDRRAGYDLLDGTGAVVSRVDGSGKRRWLVVLVPAASEVGWLVHDAVVQP